MTITLVKTTGSGRASRIAGSGVVDLNFTFPPVEDPISALTQTSGFIDALLESLEQDEDEGGLIHEPEVSLIIAVPVPGGFAPQFALTIHFYDGAAVERWLDESCLVDDELVNLVPSKVDWDLDAEEWDSLAAVARMEALLCATTKAEHYVEALNGDSLRVATIEDGVVTRRVRKGRRGKPTTLGELLTNAPKATASVKIRADFTIHG